MMVSHCIVGGNKKIVDWIIGNHSDELTPWIPFMCSKSINTRFFVLPCCMWDFQGKFTKNIKELGRYGTYLQ
jgi:tRNASer (uridine44-2'-O)-methyltransferase